jgi:UDP-hydrolysing UDP-N-acetyl-D-glucosamine 2-epimerase
MGCRTGGKYSQQCIPNLIRLADMSTPPCRKICVVSGSRADYGLLYWLLRGLHDDVHVELQLVVTGMHLSPEFGLTWQQIQADGLPIRRKVELLLSADTPTAISKAMGLGLISFADAFADLQPDLLVLLGDRFEIFAAAQAAMNARIPIAHIHGGELTAGAVDDAIRHALSKMAHLHFTATETYRQRVIQLGEQPERVFNVGAPGLDAIAQLPLLDRAGLEQALDFRLAEKNLLVTFHPVTLEHASAAAQVTALLTALDSLTNTHCIFTLPNADAEGRVIIELIEQYCQQHPERAKAFVSLGSLRYLSAMRHVDAVVGNSSSGLIEAPSFCIGTVNIGDRQQGRLAADSVLHCPPDTAAITKALHSLYSPEFSTMLNASQNPYGNGGASAKIKAVLTTYPLDGLLKKQFYDLF